MATPVGFTLPPDYTTTTNTPVPCIVTVAAPPKPVNFTDRAVYLRITLIDMYFLANYIIPSSVETQQLNEFLRDSFRNDYQRLSSGKYFNLTLANVQHPFWNQTSAFNQWPINPGPGCSIVDIYATFTNNLTQLERTAIVNVTYSKAISSNRGGKPIIGRYGSNPFAATRVGEVFYISPTNYLISPVSICTVFSNENGCRNGGYCTSFNSVPTCNCISGYEGTYCEKTSGIFLSPEWPNYQIVLVAIGACSLLALGIIVFCCCCGNKNRHFPAARTFDLDVGRHRSLTQTYLNFPLPIFQRKIVRTKQRLYRQRPTAPPPPPPYSPYYIQNNQLPQQPQRFYNAPPQFYENPAYHRQ